MSSLQSELKQAQNLIDKASLDEATEKLQFLQKKHPSEIGVLNLLGQVYLRQKAYSQAVSCFEKSLRYRNKDFMINFFVSICYEGLEQRQKSLEYLKRSVKLNDKFGLALFNLGRMLALDGQNINAIHYYKEAIKINFDDGEVYAALAVMENEIGLWREASMNFTKSYELTGKKEYLSSPIFIAQKDFDTSLEDMQALACDYYKKILEPIKVEKKYDHSAKITANKGPLKIGFISADLRTHPVGNYLISLLKRIDKNKFEIFFYYNNDLVDLVNKTLAENAKAMHMVRDFSDDDIADLIYQDQIDILIDLSGHTFGERLEVLLRKAAPVQVTHLGFPSTMGVPEIDFIIADANVVKEGEEKYFTEKVYKMPTVFTHCDLFELPSETSVLPCKQNGYITFGSMNTLHKIHPTVISVWSKILNQIPGSKLIMDSKSLANEGNRNFILNIFEKNGIDVSRITIRSTKTRKEFLNTYNLIDIALDPFPYTGGTSSIESIMMGVPFITIEGNKWAARMSTTKLKACGHEELIATNVEEYLDKYLALANDIPRLENYRKILRSDMLNSGMNIERYVKDFEKALVDMWEIKYPTSLRA